MVAGDSKFILSFATVRARPRGGHAPYTGSMFTYPVLATAIRDKGVYILIQLLVPFPTANPFCSVVFVGAQGAEQPKTAGSGRGQAAGKG